MNLSLLRLGTIIIPLCGENRSSFFARYHIYEKIFSRRIIRCRIFFFFLFKIEQDFEEKRIRVRTNMDRLGIFEGIERDVLDDSAKAELREGELLACQVAYEIE